MLRTNKTLKELNEQLQEKVGLGSLKLNNSIQDLDLANKSLSKQYNDFIRVFSRNIELRPGIKNGQSKYIAEKALLVAQKLGLSVEERKNIIYAGLLLQIGKVSLSDTLLAEPFDAMTPDNKKDYLKHALEGEALLTELSQLKGASILIRHQYERFDGLGFPEGLHRHKIPLGSRILNVVGDYIAYLEGLKTGEAMSAKEVVNKLMLRRGSHYDPEVIEAFVKLIRDELKADVVAPVEAPLAAAVLTKSWKNSKVASALKIESEERPVIEISLAQLQAGMDVEYIYFDNKPYIRQCVADQNLIDNH